RAGWRDRACRAARELIRIFVGTPIRAARGPPQHYSSASHKYCRSESSVQSYRTDAIVPVLVAVTRHLPCAKVRDARSGDRGETLVVRVVKDGDGDATVHLNRTDLVVKSIRNVHHRTARLAEVVAAEIGTGEKTRAVMRPAAGPSGTRIPPGRTAVVRSHPELRAAPTIDPDPPVIVAPALAAHTGRTARLPHQIHALASVTDRTIIASAVPRFASHHIHVGTLRRGRRHDRGICCRRRGLRRGRQKPAGKVQKCSQD